MDPRGSVSLVSSPLRLSPSHFHHPGWAACPHRLFAPSTQADRPPELTVHPWPCSESLLPCLLSWSLSICLSLSATVFSTVSPGVCLAVCVFWISVCLFLCRPFSPPPHPWLLGMSRIGPGTSHFFIRVREPFCSWAASGDPPRTPSHSMSLLSAPRSQKPSGPSGQGGRLLP